MSVLVVAHDAGGAEILSSWVRRLPTGDWSYQLSGPAVAIFRRKLGKSLREGSLDGARFLLAGTGSGSYERTWVAAAVDRGIRTVSWLDHWKNYRERFIVLPDRLWVCDEYAYQLASRVFPDARIRTKGNPYLEDTEREIARLERREREGKERERDEDVTRYLLVGERQIRRDLYRFRVAHDRERAEWRYRPHPAVAPSPRTLAEDVAWADEVVGGDSMALVVGLYARKRVVSVIPATERTIPYPEIATWT